MIAETILEIIDDLNKDKKILQNNNDYLRRSIKEKEKRILELEKEILPYTNEYIDDVLNDYDKALTSNYNLDSTLRGILKYCNYLHNNFKYNLNDYQIKRIINMCKRGLEKCHKKN